MTYARRTGALVFVLSLLAVSYLAGRSHLIGKLRERFARPVPPVQRADAAVPDIPTYVDSTASFAELRGLLFARFDSLAIRSSGWSRIVASTGSELAANKAELRARLRARFPPWSMPPIDPRPRMHHWFGSGEVRVDLVRLQVPPGTGIWCVVLRPVSRATAAPAIMFLHGNRARIESAVADVDYHHGSALALARTGMTVVAPFLPASSLGAKAELQALALGLDWTIQNIEQWQLTAVLEYMLTLPGVDSTRIGVYGISAGGERAMRLAAFDSRIALAVVSGFVTDRFWWWFLRTTVSADNLVHLQPGVADLVDDRSFLALIHPRDLIIEGGVDDARTRRARTVFDDLYALYAKTGHADRIQFVEGPGGHETFHDLVGPFVARAFER